MKNTKNTLKLFYIIPAIGLGGLAFIAYIALQSIEVFVAVKQQELLVDFSSQLQINKAQTNPEADGWIEWFNNNDLVPLSRFAVFLQDKDGKTIGFNKGLHANIDINQAKQISSWSFQDNFKELYHVHEGFKYIWYRESLPDTPYSLFIVYSSPVTNNALYFKYLGIPITLAAAIVLWVSLWLAIILANLYKRLDKQKQLIEHDALHDPLTGLPNRSLHADRLNQAIEEAKRDNDHLAICMIDLDRFKEVNDALGHEYGDKLLVEVSLRIKNIIREADTVSRLGGDEFAIILRHANANLASAIAERLSQSLKDEFIIDEKRFHISGSIGISLYPDHGTESETLMRHADSTMYHVKYLNYDYAIYNANQENERSNTLFLFTDLVEAINNDEFEIYYQPKLDVKSGTITDMEALLRWPHPTQGIIMPDLFIPLAEQTGLIRRISRLLLTQAIKDQALLESMGIDMTIAVNLSAHDLDNDSICDYLRELYEENILNSKTMVLEITESAMMFNPDTIDKTLNKLTEKGFRISIDDFGTGYSSLSNLQKMPINELKIDRSFVSDMDTDDNNARIVRGIIDLAHDLNIKVVAEGVETKAVSEILQSLNCNMLQGNIICEPMPLHAIINKYWPQSRTLSKL